MKLFIYFSLLALSIALLIILFPAQKSVSTCLVWNEDRFLIVQNARGPFKYSWAPPGGKAEFFESAKETVQRELFEETGLFVQYPDLTHIATYMADHGSVGKFKISVFEVEYFIKPIIVLNPKEHTDFAWITLSEMDNYLFIPNNVEHIKEIYNMGEIGQ